MSTTPWLPSRPGIVDLGRSVAVVARDELAVVSRGTHRRAVIDRQRFTDRMQVLSPAPAAL